MDVHGKRKFDIMWIGVLLLILTLSVATVWKRQDEVRNLEKKLGIARADLAEVRGDLADMQGTPIDYLLLYRQATLARFERIEPRWDEIMEASWNAARKNGVPPHLYLGIIEHESNFDPNAIGPKGEMGLSAVYPPAWPQFNLSKGFEIEYNTNFGCMILSSCLKAAHGDIKRALTLYNGTGPLPEGVRPYHERVLNGRVMNGRTK